MGAEKVRDSAVVPSTFSEYWSGPAGRVTVLEPALTVLGLPAVKLSANFVARPAAAIWPFM